MLWFNRVDNRSNLNGNNNLNYNNSVRGITQAMSGLKSHQDFTHRTVRTLIMNEQDRLYLKICSHENLEAAFKKARKRKSTKPYVIF